MKSHENASEETRLANSASPSSGIERRGVVLFVTSSLPRWSGDSTTPFILHLAQDLNALGWNVHILAPHAPGARKNERLDEVTVERFRYLWPESMQTLCYGGGALINLRQKRSNLLKVPFLVSCEWTAVTRLLMRLKPDLVHSHWLLPQGFTCGLAARSLRIPHIATIHGSDIFALNGVVTTACKKLALRLADAVTVNSSVTRTAVARIFPHMNRVTRIPIGASVPPPADPERMNEIRARHRRGRGPLIAFVGRLVEEKGVDDLLFALSLCKDALPDATVMIIGEGPERAKLEQMARELRITDRVVFTGWIQSERIDCHLRAADIFVGPSKRTFDGRQEAQGLTFAEALLAGIPVVATRCGGIIDTIRHEETGLLVNESAPSEIADAMRRLAADPALAKRLQENGRALAHRELSREASARAFSALYQGTLSRDRAGTAPSAVRGASVRD